MDEENYYAQLKRAEDDLFKYLIDGVVVEKGQFYAKLDEIMHEKLEHLAEERSNQK